MISVQDAIQLGGFLAENLGCSKDGNTDQMLGTGGPTKDETSETTIPNCILCSILYLLFSAAESLFLSFPII